MTTKFTVGLFGTCGSSTWRDFLIAYLDYDKIPFFNPLRADWKHEHIAEENRHLQTDDIVIFAVTNETTGFGSLAEIGFSVLNTYKTDQRLIVMIDHDCLDPKADEKTRKESVNARALVKSKLLDHIGRKVWVVSTTMEMIPVISLIVRNQL